MKKLQFKRPPKSENAPTKKKKIATIVWSILSTFYKYNDTGNGEDSAKQSIGHAHYARIETVNAPVAYQPAPTHQRTERNCRAEHDEKHSHYDRFAHLMTL